MGPPLCQCGQVKRTELYSESMRALWADREGDCWEWHGNVAYWKLCWKCHMCRWPGDERKKNSAVPRGALAGAAGDRGPRRCVARLTCGDCGPRPGSLARSTGRPAGWSTRPGRPAGRPGNRPEAGDRGRASQLWEMPRDAKRRPKRRAYLLHGFPRDVDSIVENK